MKTKVFLSVIILLFMNGCDSDEDILTYDLAGDWTVISFENYETSAKICKLPFEQYVQKYQLDVAGMDQTIFGNSFDVVKDKAPTYSSIIT